MGAVDLLREVARIAQDAGDRQMWGWALHDLGLATLCVDGSAEAVAPLKQSVELLSAVPDFPSVAIALSYLGQCYLRQGRVDETLFVLEEANRIVDERGFGLRSDELSLAYSDRLGEQLSIDGEVKLSESTLNVSGTFSVLPLRANSDSPLGWGSAGGPPTSSAPMPTGSTSP